MNANLNEKFKSLALLYRKPGVKPSAIAVTPEEFDALCDVFAPQPSEEDRKALPPGFHLNGNAERTEHCWPFVEFSYRGRPSWKNSGEGVKSVKVTKQSDGSLDVKAVEMVLEDGLCVTRGMKEVYFSVPRAVVNWIKTYL